MSLSNSAIDTFRLSCVSVWPLARVDVIECRSARKCARIVCVEFVVELVFGDDEVETTRAKKLQEARLVFLDVNREQSRGALSALELDADARRVDDDDRLLAKRLVELSIVVGLERVLKAHRKASE